MHTQITQEKHDRAMDREIGRIEKPGFVYANMYSDARCFFGPLRVPTTAIGTTRNTWAEKARAAGVQGFSIHFSTGPEVLNGHSPYVIKR